MSESARKRISLGDSERPAESMLEPRTAASSSTPPPALDAGLPPDGASKDTHRGGKDSAAAADGDGDAHSHVSSLTGGVDHEIVEELHQAIIELRSELDASRAEAARAVKVAEQAIQSAENCTSSDWNSTVTHKAAEAAAQAQKRSAEAIARARMAEERLAAERRSTGFWRRQAQAAEEEAGGLKTRSAAAEVRRAAAAEELAGERRRAARMFAGLKSEFVAAERRQAEEAGEVVEQKRAAEAELQECREELRRKDEEARRAAEADVERREKAKGPARMRPNFRRTRSAQPQPRSKDASDASSTAAVLGEGGASTDPGIHDRVPALRCELAALRGQLETVRRVTAQDVRTLRRQTEDWSNRASRAVAEGAAEADHLRERLAAEGAMRLKLLNELQDLRGTVRVYCRPRPCKRSAIKIPTHDILVLNEETKPTSFKFDRVFPPGASQHEVFAELEEPLISSLDGFNVTMLAFGQWGSGKTHTLLGDVVDGDAGVEGESPSLKSHGVQLQAIQQLFIIASHRTDRYKDTFSMTVVEVHNEKLFDLVAGTPSAERDGEVVFCETRDGRRDKHRESSGAGSEAWRKGKLEIRTNIDGNTVVQGLISIPIRSFEDVVTIWRESLAGRAERLRRQGSDPLKHERRTNVIATVHIASVNVATGVGTEGKLQFVDMAASNVASGASGGDVGDRATEAAGDAARGEEGDSKFADKSIDAFNDVVNARCQFDRSVPYRNSTLTHLLRDSLEADAKVLLLCCVSSEEGDADNTVAALRFASRMQKVSIGKATKHIIGSKE